MPSITLPVREVIHATPRTRIIRLDLQGATFPFSAGQAVMVGLEGSPLRKPYSIVSAPVEAARTGVMELLLQIEDSGALDPHLELAAAGARLDLEGPFGSFGLPDPPGPDPLLFIAGGTGIAPLRSMIVERLSTGHAPPISLVYSARSVEELVYRAEFDALHRAHRLAAFLTVTREHGRAWTGRHGRIDAALLRAALPSPEVRCIACGPPHLVDHVRALLIELGVPADRFLTQRT